MKRESVARSTTNLLDPAAVHSAQQWAELLDILEPKLTRRRDRDLCDTIRAFAGKPHQLASDSEIKRLSKAAATPARRPQA